MEQQLDVSQLKEIAPWNEVYLWKDCVARGVSDALIRKAVSEGVLTLYCVSLNSFKRYHHSELSIDEISFREQ